MKKMIILFSLVLLVSCDKPNPPSAQILVTGSTKVIPNESIVLSSTGSIYDHLKWTLPDGSTSTASTITFSSASEGLFPISLTAYSKKEKHKAESTVIITVENPTPVSLTIWTPNINLIGFDVLIEGVYAGTLSAYYFSKPPCGSLGCVTSQLLPGNYTVTITNGFNVYNGTVNVTESSCNTYYF